MSAKICARPGCDRKLYANNVKGVCANIKKCGAAKQAADALEIDAPVVRRREPPPAPKPASGATETLKRFRLLAEAIGFDPDLVLAEFASGWLERARQAVQAVGVTPAPAKEPAGILLSALTQRPRFESGPGHDSTLAGPELADEDEDTAATDFIRQTAEVRITGGGR